MYATIRRYSSKTAATKETIDGLKRRIEEKFVPTIQDIRGFHTYGVLNVGDKELLSISIFEDRQGSAESTLAARPAGSAGQTWCGKTKNAIGSTPRLGDQNCRTGLHCI